MQNGAVGLIIARAVPRDLDSLPGLSPLRSAASRLAHDLGKYVRLSAPARRENSVEELRRRLEADLLQTRSGPFGKISAPEIFDAWQREEAEGFSPFPALAARVAGISAGIEEIRGLLSRWDRLSHQELLRLDEAALEVAQRCRELHRAVSEEKV